ncbi:lipopolysaccharide assembly protein LapB [Stappia sp. ES.058]|uniref:tetratricopeptide repeat protein n=1 Tax=Stappia sp. ES.058 TaxID=1881061 RepID=UPI00087C42A1|nr:tetratricopeptide repeat protein [Stappia sp. ES.058]SDU24501.1 Tetratricopeptide (TPR) repeat [Stappia sp. ES.058]
MLAPSPAILEQMRKALVLQRDGKIGRARAIYEKILKKDPHNTEAAHLLALCFREQGFPARARAIVEGIIARPQADPRHHITLADICAETDDSPSALAAVEAGLQDHPNHAGLLAQRARLVLETQGPAPALPAFDPAVRANPGDADLLCDYAKALYLAGAVEEALKILTFLRESAPDHATSILLAIDILNARDRAPEALALLREAQEPLEAAPAIARSLSRANTLWSNASYDEALAHARHALELEPDNPLARLIHGKSLFRLGRFDEAAETLSRGLALHPKNADLRNILGFVEVRRGNLATGWAHLEARFSSDQPGTIHRSFDQPAWTGDSDTGRGLLLWSDQGVGDVFRATTMLRETVALAGRVILECGSKNLEIMSRNFPDVTFRANALDKLTRRPVHDDFDTQLSLGSLPMILRPTLDSFPKRAQWITPEPGRVARFSDRGIFRDGRPVIGLSWRGRTKGNRNAHLYISLEALRPILQRDDCVFLSLQYGDLGDELARLKAETGIEITHFDDIDIFDDLENAAALSSLVDLYIAPDCTGADIAATLGVPVWRYAGTTSPILAGDGSTPWYPSTRSYVVPAGRSADALVPRLASDFDDWRKGRDGKNAATTARMSVQK